MQAKSLTSKGWADCCPVLLLHSKDNLLLYWWVTYECNLYLIKVNKNVHSLK